MNRIAIATIILAFSILSNAEQVRHENMKYSKYFMVKFKAEAVKKNLNLIDTKVAAFSLKSKTTVSHVKKYRADLEIYKLNHYPGEKEMESILDEIKKDPEVESVEPVLRVWPMTEPNDPLYSYQWHYCEASVEKAALNLPLAWDITTGSTSTVVAVIDTGILTHVDIDAGRILPGYDMILDVDIANDGDGRDADPSDPGDWCTDTEKKTPNSPCYDNRCETNPSDPHCQTSDSSWHGLHVTGTIGANTNNSSGVAGIDWNNKILPVRVLGKGGGVATDMADAIRWAAGLPVSGLPLNGNAARVINMSLAGLGACPSMIQDAINSAVSAGATVVVAAGNSNDYAYKYFPANCQNVITVAAINRNGDKASYSNYGTAVSLSAPGGETGNSIYSTLNNGQTVPANDIYAGYSGTSMATPHVSGLISLMLGYKPLLSTSEINYNLLHTARAFPSGSSCLIENNCGVGIADAVNALNNLSPSITSITPNTGRNDGPVSITDLSGTGFLSGASVKLKKSGYPDIFAQNVSVVNLNKIICDFPISGASTGTWNVEVLNLDGSSVTINNAFTISYPPPSLTSITPSSGTNTGDVNITDLSGANFISGATVKLSKIGSSEFSANSVTVVSPTKITCVLPLAGKDIGFWDVTVTNPDGQSFTLSDSFEIKLPPPSLTSITPSSGTNTSFANISSIRGSNFNITPPPSIILRRAGYSDIYAQDISVVNSSTITCNFNIIGAVAGLWSLVVTNPDGQSAKLTDAFEIKNPQPTISSIYPNEALNFGNINVSINGNYFRSGVVAKLKKSGSSDIDCYSLILTGNYKINCSLSLTGVSSGNWDVWVSNTDGQTATLPGAFIINNEAPYPESLSANAAINTAPFPLEIYGHGFLTGASVKLSKTGQADINAYDIEVSSDKIKCNLPLTGVAAGDWKLSVSNTDGKTSYYGDYFHVLAKTDSKPKIYGGIINPSQGEKAHIVYKTSSSGRYSVKIYDQSGRLVMTVFEGQRSAGNYEDVWAGINEAGKKVSSGVYFVRIETPEYKENRRILVVR